MPTKQEKRTVLFDYKECAELEMEAERRRMSVSNLIRLKLGLPPLKWGRAREKAERVEKFT